MLLGAHGVAPGKGSLSRRVKRVLDAALDRAPGGWKWSSAAAFFAAGMTVPVAALQFVSLRPLLRQRKAIALSRALRGLRPWRNRPSPASAARDAAVANYMASRTGETVALAQNDKKIVIGKNGSLDAQINATVTCTALAQAGVATTTQGRSYIDRAIELKALGASPRICPSMRQHHAEALTHDDIVDLGCARRSA